MNHKFSSTSVLLLAWYCCVCSGQTKPGDTTISFFLPFHSSQFPELAVKFDAALKRNGLDHFQTRTTDYWHAYQRGVRQGKPGIYLAAPHFAAWAIHKHGFVPILKLTQPLKYVIAARSDDSQYFEVNDLAGQTVCSQAAVNLDFLLVHTALNDGFLAAQNRIVNSVASAMQYDNQHCAAFSVSEHLLQQFNRESPDRFIRLQQGREFSNYVFIAHPGIDTAGVRKITQMLRQQAVQTTLYPLLKQFSAKPTLSEVEANDYPLDYLEPLQVYWR